VGLTFWVWVMAAVVLLVGEVLGPGYYLLPFGVGAACAAGASALHASPNWQWAVFVGVTSVLTIVLRRTSSRGRRR